MRLLLKSIILAAALWTNQVHAANNDLDKIKTVVLVHGAWADGTGSWQKIVPLLQAEGLKVVVVQNPNTSLADGARVTTRVINSQAGRVLLVGHSWGGAIITEAGANMKVAGLVYVAGFAPDSGQSVGELASAYPQSAAFSELVPDIGGFIYMSERGIRNYFAQDLSRAQQRLIFATQVPLPLSTLTNKVTTAAWRVKPNWYVVATQDRTIQPQLERDVAKRMNAKTTVLRSSHVAMLSHPREVTNVILDALEELNR